MKTREAKEEVSTNLNGALAEMMSKLAEDAEKVVQDTGKEVRQELATEIAIITEQYKKKKEQIMEKAIKNANERTVRLTANIKENFVSTIEQASTEVVSGVIEEVDKRFEDLVKIPFEQNTRDQDEIVVEKESSKHDGTPQTGEKTAEVTSGEESVENINKDEISISTINIEDEAETKTDFVGWLQE